MPCHGRRSPCTRRRARARAASWAAARVCPGAPGKRTAAWMRAAASWRATVSNARCGSVSARGRVELPPGPGKPPRQAEASPTGKPEPGLATPLAPRCDTETDPSRAVEVDWRLAIGDWRPRAIELCGVSTPPQGEPNRPRSPRLISPACAHTPDVGGRSTPGIPPPCRGVPVLRVPVRPPQGESTQDALCK